MKKVQPIKPPEPLTQAQILEAMNKPKLIDEVVEKITTEVDGNKDADILKLLKKHHVTLLIKVVETIGMIDQKHSIQLKVEFVLRVKDGSWMHNVLVGEGDDSIEITKKLKKYMLASTFGLE